MGYKGFLLKKNKKCCEVELFLFIMKYWFKVYLIELCLVIVVYLLVCIEEMGGVVYYLKSYYLLSKRLFINVFNLFRAIDSDLVIIVIIF